MLTSSFFCSSIDSSPPFRPDQEKRERNERHRREISLKSTATQILFYLFSLSLCTLFTCYPPRWGISAGCTLRLTSSLPNGIH